MTSKFDQFVKASWNAIFSAQEAPRRASAADRRSGRSRPEATGGGFRRGKTEPPRRRIQKEESGDPGSTIQHADPGGRRIEAPLGGSTAAQRFWSKEVCDKERSLEERSFEI